MTRFINSGKQNLHHFLIKSLSYTTPPSYIVITLYEEGVKKRGIFVIFNNTIILIID